MPIQASHTGMLDRVASQSLLVQLPYILLKTYHLFFTIRAESGDFLTHHRYSKYQTFLVPFDLLALIMVTSQHNKKC